jgi:hypothetical protein
MFLLAMAAGWLIPVCVQDYYEPFELRTIIPGIVAGVAVWIAITGVIALFRSGLENDHEDVLKTTSTNPIVTSIVRQMRARSRSLRTTARVTLFLLIGVLIGGAALFTFADSLARSSIQNTALFAARDQAEKVSDEIMDVVTKRFQTNALPTNAVSAASSLTYMYKSELKMKLQDEISTTLESSADRLSDRYAQQKTNYLMVSTLSTRIGTILLYLFLVQILVALYRYNIRLAAFYDGRADTLQLVSLDTTNGAIEPVMRIVCPDAVDFGSTPRPLTEKAVEAAGRMVSAVATKGDKI